MQAETESDLGPFKGKNLIGKKFGRLTVISLNRSHRADKFPRKTYWNCACDCGSRGLHVVGAGPLVSGNTQSCGCLHRERTSQACKTHGMSRHPFYENYLKMFKRCYNEKCPDYKDYGARGIYVCDEWHKFENFKRDMFSTWDAKLTIGRIDNDGPYRKSNCRWENDFEQANNRRNNHLVTCRGETRTIAEWANDSPVAYGTISARLALGWSDEDAVFTPLQKNQFG